MTSSELGRKSYTSQAAVTRFYKKLGFKTYREFLSTLIIERHDYFKNHIFDDDLWQYFASLEDTKGVLTSLYEQTIIQTNLLLDQNAMTRVCNRIMSAMFIDIYGMGISDATAKQMTFKLQSRGLSCLYHSDLNEAYIRNISFPQRHVSILISINDHNEIMKTLAKILKEKKIYTVGIFDKKTKDMQQMCNDCLLFDTSVFEDMKNMCSMVAVDYVINIIYSSLIYRKQMSQVFRQCAEEKIP